jgi:hypothetical protein
MHAVSIGLSSPRISRFLLSLTSLPLSSICPSRLSRKHASLYLLTFLSYHSTISLPLASHSSHTNLSSLSCIYPLSLFVTSSLVKIYHSCLLFSCHFPSLPIHTLEHLSPPFSISHVSSHSILSSVSLSHFPLSRLTQ